MKVSGFVLADQGAELGHGGVDPEDAGGDEDKRLVVFDANFSTC